MFFSIPYQGNNMTGLFAYMRQTKQIITIRAPYGTAARNFCNHNISGGNASALVDGNNLTAWANENLDPTETYFIVDIGFPFFFGSYTFKLLCGPPKSWKVFGSNDNLEWSLVDDKTISLQEDTTYHFTAKFPNQYRFIKVQQLIPTYSDHRFHLNEIEFFSPILSRSCNNKVNLRDLVSFPLFMILAITIYSKETMF